MRKRELQYHMESCDSVGKWALGEVTQRWKDLQRDVLWDRLLEKQSHGGL